MGANRLGLVGTGLLAVPVLSSSAAYAVKEFAGIRGDLAARVRDRPTFYAVIGLATVAGAGMNFLGVDPIRALFLVAVVNGVVAVPLLALITLVGSDRSVMRDQVSGRLSRSLTWTTTALMAAAAAAMLFSIAAR